MKTVQEYLKTADRENLLNAYADRRLSDVLLLLEHKDRKVSEILDAIKSCVNGLIDELLSVKPELSDHMVFYLAESLNGDDIRSLCLSDINELKSDIYEAEDYGVDLCDARTSLGYLVAETKLTQDYIQDLLVQYMDDLSFYGYDLKRREENIQEVHDSLNEAMKQIEEGKYRSEDEVFDELHRKYGLPIDEKDEFMDELEGKVREAEMRFARYSFWRERKRILERLGVSVEPYKNPVQ